MKTKTFFNRLFLVSVLLCFSAFSSFAQGVLLTSWQMNRGLGYQTFGAPAYTPCQNMAGWSLVNVPAANAPNWVPAPGPMGLSSINFDEPSITLVPACYTGVDYTYFQSSLFIPVGFVTSSLTASFAHFDDISHIRIYNSANPTGATIAASFFPTCGGGVLPAPYVIGNLASLVQAGEVNRVVIVHRDACRIRNIVRGVVITVNGIQIPANSVIPVPTLSQWGLVILGLSILIVGVIALIAKTRMFRKAAVIPAA